MGNYTTPFFGDRDMGQYTPPSLDYASYFENRNRQDVVKYNDKGQVYQADVLCIYSLQGGWTLRENTNPSWFPGSFTNSMIASQFTLISESDRPYCIFAMPCCYGNIRNTATEQYEWARACVSEFNDIPNYYYFIIGKTNGASLTMDLSNNQVSGRGRSQAYANVGSFVTGQNSVSELANLRLTDVINGTQSDSTPLSTTLRKITATNGLVYLFNTLNNPDSANSTVINSAFPDIYNVSKNDIIRLTTLLGAWATLEDTVINNVYFGSLWDFTNNRNLNTPYLTSSYNPVGSFIATGLPVFTLDSFDQMVKYFQGDEWIAENEVPPPSDWSTDWDIYVKGAQRPDIFITMQSSKVDEWLESSDENKSGTKKSDIKVEYRYTIAGSVGDNDIDSGKKVNWLNDTYNDTRSTTYIENVELNYQGNMELFGEFSDFTIMDLMDIYAEMEFRITYGKYKSTWCRYKIGVIGSPSIPDFSKMRNEGEQWDEWQDNSTVTLHYDEYPPDYDPYPEPPEPDMPEPKPTYPSPSETGLGLLTTTYKVTKANLQALGRFFWGGDLFQKIKALNLSPIENVVGVHLMPINIDGTTEIITIGDVKTNVNGDKIDEVPLYELGEVEIKGRYSYYNMNYLDYEPYTTAHIFLPFVGFVRIDPQFFTNKTLKVIYSYDIICGLCNAMLFANDIYIESHQGNCGIDIPLVSSNRAELAVGLATSLINTAADAATTKAAAFSTLGTSVSVLDSLSDFVSGFHSSRQGGYSPACAWTETRECFVVLETPNASIGTTFAHDFGRPCMSTYSIALLSGFTICDSSVDLSGIAGATEEEKDMIRELLTTGFYA